MRKCENWLQTFAQWTLPRSEAPESFVAWTGLFVLSSVLRRKVKIPKKYLGSWEVYPNLYILFIAPAGRARKSTTANYAEDLLDNITGITKSPELVTKEDILQKIVKSDDHSMYILSPEFGEFIAKSGPPMFSFLTNMYDGKKNISSSTLSRGSEFAEKPCVNLLGATTPAWVAESMPESVIGGGFASRVIFVHEEKVRRRKLFYDDLVASELGGYRDRLIDDLKHINETIVGDYELTTDAKDFMETWYDDSGEEGYSNNPKLSGYYERRPAHIFKVAILNHVAYSDSMVLDKVDFEMALQIVKGLEKNLPKVFESVGKNPYSADATQIMNYVIENGRCTSTELKQAFRSSATPNMLNEIIGGLIEAKLLTVEMDKDQIVWVVPNLEYMNASTT